MEKVNFDKKSYDLEEKDALFAKLLIKLIAKLEKLTWFSGA